MSSTVPRSRGAPGRFGSQAGKSNVRDPAQISNPRSSVCFHLPNSSLRFSFIDTKYVYAMQHILRKADE
jgi:hypothetical protein